MNIEDDVIDLLIPQNKHKILSNHDILYGKSITPMQRLAVMDDAEFEEIVTEWAFEYLNSKYEKVRRCGGAGDKGRDVIGIKNSSTKKWDNFQCKHYGNKLTPTNFYVELGKLCHYTFISDYTIPDNYYIVSREGIGTTLGDLLDNPDKLKIALIDNWANYVESKITLKGSGKIKLEGSFKSYVENFDFSIVKSVEPLELIEQHSQTSYYLYHFGGSIKKYREETSVPQINNYEEEMRYVQQLLIAYGEELSLQINSVDELTKHGHYLIHFNFQRTNFHSVETLKQFERDNLPPNSIAFESLKEEIYNAVYSKVLVFYKNSFHRLLGILEHSTNLNITANPLTVTISLHDKQGICHHLVNENKLSWKL